jgi:hypothetical protein
MKYLTYLNSGCKEICDNMLFSAEKVGIKKEQFIIVAFDRPIHEYYENRGYSVELFRDVPEERYHNWTWDETSGFRNLIKNKWVLIKKYFESNKPLMWVDTDIVFLKNPEEHLSRITKPTFQMDYPVKCACTGLMYFPDHEFSSEIIEKLGSQNKEDDQIVCNRFLETPEMKDKFEYFDLNEFPNGGYFYDAKGTTVEKITMLHCNYIVGLENKITRLKQTGVWYL